MNRLDFQAGIAFAAQTHRTRAVDMPLCYSAGLTPTFAIPMSLALDFGQIYQYPQFSGHID